MDQEGEAKKLTLAEEWAEAPKWRRDAAKKRVRGYREWLGILRRRKEEREGEEDGIEMAMLEAKREGGCEGESNVRL